MIIRASMAEQNEAIFVENSSATFRSKISPA